MNAKQIRQKVSERLANGECSASLVLACFSSIYACRGELRD